MPAAALPPSIDQADPRSIVVKISDPAQLNRAPDDIEFRDVEQSVLPSLARGQEGKR
jgi:hypothetical protein